MKDSTHAQLWDAGFTATSGSLNSPLWWAEAARPPNDVLVFDLIARCRAPPCLIRERSDLPR